MKSRLYDSTKYIVSMLFVIATHRLRYRRISIRSFSMYRQKSRNHVGFTHVGDLGTGVNLLYPCIMRKSTVKTLLTKMEAEK